MRKKWTEFENNLIRLFYPDRKTETIVCLFTDRTVTQIQGHAAVIGVKKSEAFMKSPESGRISKSNDIGAATRFTALTGGWNKGKKQSDYMSPEAIERTKTGRFKKGNVPHNHVSIGHERITVDGYIEVKVRDVFGDGKNNNFELKHRLLWEQNNGPIPENMNLRIKDGKRLDFELSDLYLVSKKENLEMNFESDKAIAKRFFKVKEPKDVEEFVKNNPELIEVRRKIITVNKKLNGRNRKINGAAD